MKHCPFCAEEIQDAAIKCKHCGSMLSPLSPNAPPPLPASAAAREVIPWRFRSSTLILAFLVVGPLMLPMLWFNPHLDSRKKLVWTVVITVVTAFLTWIMMLSIRRLMEHWDEIRQLLSGS